MAQLLESYLKTKSHIESSYTFKLLRARSFPLIVTFLYREYKGGQEIAIPYQQALLKLADYLEEIDYNEDDEELSDSGKLIHDYYDKAKIYLDKWIDSYYLQNIVDDNTKQPVVILSKHVEKVFQVFDLVKQKEFVGTESKFRDIFSKLKDLLENANPDKEKRIEELERRKQQIEEEIRRIKIDGYISTYENFQIKSRFEEINRLSNELVGDFREVEDNFKSITRKIYENQQSAEATKGKLLQETFDAIYELKNTDQGKSFYAFWHFMIDEQAQEELQGLTSGIYQLLEDRDIEFNSKSLRKLKALLHMAGRKVLDKNALLADKLSREIIAKEHKEHRKTKELMADIRKKAFAIAGNPIMRPHYLEIDGFPEVYLPLERKLGEKADEENIVIQPILAVPGDGNIEALSKLYNTSAIDKKALIAHINEALESREQISLKELVALVPISQGLPELLAYISLLNVSPKYFINHNAKELILFNAQTGKHLETPQIIFSR
jgi:hypothetical protein